MEVPRNDLALTYLVPTKSIFSNPFSIFHSIFFSFSEPPSPPEITGLPKNHTLREGQSVSLTCTATDGSPKPHLAWYV